MALARIHAPVEFGPWTFRWFRVGVVDFVRHDDADGGVCFVACVALVVAIEMAVSKHIAFSFTVNIRATCSEQDPSQRNDPFPRGARTKYRLKSDYDMEA